MSFRQMASSKDTAAQRGVYAIVFLGACRPLGRCWFDCFFAEKILFVIVIRPVYICFQLVGWCDVGRRKQQTRKQVMMSSDVYFTYIVLCSLYLFEDRCSFLINRLDAARSLCVQDTLKARQREPLHHAHNNSHIIYTEDKQMERRRKPIYSCSPFVEHTNLKICIAAEHYKKKIEMGKNKVRDMNGEHRMYRSESV